MKPKTLIRFLTPLCFLPLAAFAQVNLANGLVAKFNVNGNTLDSSGNGHDAVVSGIHSYVADRFGTPGSAFRIDAPGVFSEGNGMALGGSSLSLSFWYLKYWDPLDRPIIRVGTPSSAGQQLLVMLDYPLPSQPDLRFTFFFNDLDVFTAPPQSIDQWYHAVLTFDSVSLERNVYLDGSLAASDTAAYGFSGDGYFYFGMFGVAVDDLAFYNRVLTADEVTALHSVPEPSSIVLSALGGVLLMWKCRPTRK